MKKKRKIPYDEAIADGIIAAGKAKPAAKRVWKARGHIPGAYLDDLDQSPTLPAADPVAARIIALLSRPEIGKTQFKSLGQKGSDLVRGGSSLTEAEANAFVAECAEVRQVVAQALRVPTLANYRAVLADPRLVATRVMPADLTKKITGHDRRDLTKDEIATVTQHLMALRILLKGVENQ